MSKITEADAPAAVRMAGCGSQSLFIVTQSDARLVGSAARVAAQLAAPGHLAVLAPGAHGAAVLAQAAEAIRTVGAVWLVVQPAHVLAGVPRQPARRPAALGAVALAGVAALARDVLEAEVLAVALDAVGALVIALLAVLRSGRSQRGGRAQGGMQRWSKPGTHGSGTTSCPSSCAAA